MTEINKEEEVDLLAVWRILRKSFFKLLLTGIVLFTCTYFYVRTLPDVFRSEASLTPVDTEKSGSSLLGSLGNFAPMMGLNLGGGKADQSVMAIEILKSRAFLIKFIRKYDLTKHLFSPEEKQQTELKACAKLQNMLSVSSDSKTRAVKISIESTSPELAQQWVTNLIQEINEEMKHRDLTEAQKSLEYLYKQISETNIADIKTIFYQLIEEQTKTMMLINVREEYVLKTIDPAIVPEEKIKPKRLYISLGTAVLGTLALLAFLVIKDNIQANDYRNSGHLKQ